MREYIKTDRNGTKYFRTTCKCWKCGGCGTYYWGAVINGNPQYAGVCYACGGSGVTETVEKEYTPEHEAKLQVQREKREAKRLAEREAEEAKREEARKAREEAQAKREAEWAEQRAKSQYVGNVGDKVDGIFTIDFEATYEVPSFRGYGTTEMAIYGLRDENGNRFVWKTCGVLGNHDGVDEYGRPISVYGRKGDKVRIKGTIKAHDEYKDEKQNVLTRVKLVEVVERTIYDADGNLIGEEE